MTPPSQIAHYKITGKLGEGGMGAVYRATDTKLNREVAIKILPEAFAADPDRLARFTREAQVLAGLNHPNIATVHGIEDRAIVMELVEGEDLRGPLPFATALNYAGQIADALEAAHEKGIVHRDLKPANIRINSQGLVKVLDFGLAKIAEASGGAASGLSSPTLTMRATEAGMVLGTAAYMAPEQARGKMVDRRADIWAFGVVLWEMITGRRLFEGETVSDILAGVLTKEPDLNAVPASIRPVLAACLEKDPRKRLRDIGDWRRLIASGPAAAPAASRRRNWLPWAIAGTAVAALAASFALRAPATQPTSLVRVAEELGEPLATENLHGPAFALSPDGSRIAYVTKTADGQSHLSIRRFEQPSPMPLVGTEGAGGPFFSQDGRSLGYVTDEGIYKMPADGGPVVQICRTGSGVRGANWINRNTIVFGGATVPLRTVPDTGGEPVQLLRQEAGESGHRWPEIAPDGEHVVFMVSNRDSMAGPTLMAYGLRDGKRTKVLVDGSFPQFLPSGELSFLRAGALYAVPLDRQFQPTAEPRTILKDIAAFTETGASQFRIAGNGTAAYIPGWFDLDRPNLTWLYADGSQKVLASAPQAMSPHISPDGKRVAYGVGTAIVRTANDFYVRDLERGATTRVTTDGKGKHPGTVWTPDERYLIFGATDGVYQVPSDGSAAPRKLLDGDLFPRGFSKDERSLLLVDAGQLRSAPAAITPDGVSLGSSTILFPVVGANAVSTFPNFSADGKWVAYGSAGLFVHPFQSAGSRYQVGVGDWPVWSRSGLNLYFLQAARIMAVNCAAQGDSFHCDTPRRWSDQPLALRGGTGSFDVAADGSILALTLPQAPNPAPPRVHFLFNFLQNGKAQ